MENRDRDKLSQNKTSTPSGDLNRNKSQDIDKSKGDKSVEFGKNIEKSEDLGKESGRRSGSMGSSGMQGDSGRIRSSNEYGDEGLGSPLVGSKHDKS